MRASEFAGVASGLAVAVSPPRGLPLRSVGLGIASRARQALQVPATHVSSFLFLFVVDSKRVYLSLGLLGIQSGSINF